MTHRIEPFLKDDSQNWTNFTNLTHSKKSTLVDLFYHYSKNWIFLRLTELNLFVQFDSLNWILLQNMIHSFLQKNMTYRIEPFLDDSKNWTFSIWPKELNFFSCDSNHWTLFFFNMTQRFFEKHDSQNWSFLMYDSKNWKFFVHDSKNWTFFFVHKSKN